MPSPPLVVVARLLAVVFWILSGFLWLALGLGLLEDLFHWKWDFYLPYAIPMFLAALFLPFIAGILWTRANKREGI
jgi:hypothetical protein